MIYEAIQQLVNYGLQKGLIAPADEIYIRNQILITMQLDDFEVPANVEERPLNAILDDLTQNAVECGICDDNGTARETVRYQAYGYPHTPAQRSADGVQAVCECLRP